MGHPFACTSVQVFRRAGVDDVDEEYALSAVAAVLELLRISGILQPGSIV